MKLYPNLYLNDVTKIDIEMLNKFNIKALILDVDNTLIDYDKNLSDDKVEWAKKLKEKGIKLYILSNTNKREKVENVANKIGIPYELFACKPFRWGFKKIQKKLDLNKKNIAVVGDQIFTDVIGGNRCKMFTILVDPVAEKDFWYTAFKRPIENKIKNKLVKRRNKCILMMLT